MSEQSEWRKVGVIGVDAGLCWVGDPCYCVTPDSSEHPAETWGEFCSKLSAMNLRIPPTKDELRPPTDEELKKAQRHNNAQQWNYKSGHPGLGVTVSTGYGDGTYAVYVRENSEGCVKELKIVFIDDRCEDDYEYYGEEDGQD